MDKINSIEEFLKITTKFSKKFFYRGESSEYDGTSCVATATRCSSNYDSYSTRIESFDIKIREGGLLNEPEQLIPYAQHSGLATKLLDVTSNPLVALYFACEKLNLDSDGYVYVFDDYVDMTEVLDKYPNFDLENELIKHLEMLGEQKRELLSNIPNEESDVIEYPPIEHDELQIFGKCIEQYFDKYAKGNRAQHLKKSGPFEQKCMQLNSIMEGIKKWAIKNSSINKDIVELFPTNYTEDPPAIDFVHPYREKRYYYYNEQYKKFNSYVKEYLISLECIVAFVNDKSPLGNLAGTVALDEDILTMDFLPNMLYRPVMKFKRGLSQQSAFFVQALFDKHGVSFIKLTGEEHNNTPRQSMKCKANYTKKIAIDGKSKESILEELDKIGINKATMFGDADSIAKYIMETTNE